jgi:hypothetical protein
LGGFLRGRQILPASGQDNARLGKEETSTGSHPSLTAEDISVSPVGEKMASWEKVKRV